MKKTSIPENVILGNVREMTKDDDAILEEAADTTAKQLADGWLTWANTQQPPTTSQAPENTEQKQCDLASMCSKAMATFGPNKRNGSFWSQLILIVSFL